MFVNKEPFVPVKSLNNTVLYVPTVGPLQYPYQEVFLYVFPESFTVRLKVLCVPSISIVVNTISTDVVVGFVINVLTAPPTVDIVELKNVLGFALHKEKV